MTDDQKTTHHHLVVGVDGSESSLAALEWAAGQAELTKSTLEVVSTWEWPTSYGWAYPIPSDFDPAAETKNTITEFIRPVKEAHPDVVISSVIIEGHPAPTLVEASRSADLLVVGSRGHGEFVGMVFGSVSEFCSHHALCPVVVIH